MGVKKLLKSIWRKKILKIIFSENAKELDEEQESVSSTASTLKPVAPEKSPQIINLSRKSPAKSDIVLSSDTEEEEDQAKGSIS